MIENIFHNMLKKNYKETGLQMRTLQKTIECYRLDHKNGNRSDNGERNCQALCPNCHAIKTRRGYSKI